MIFTALVLRLADIQIADGRSAAIIATAEGGLLFTAETATKTAMEAVQIHGGYGNMLDY